MKKHQFECLLKELAASEELPGWQDELHRMVEQELMPSAGRKDKTMDENGLIITECPLQNHDNAAENEA